MTAALAQLLGDTRSEAKRKLEEKLQRRQELIKEREAKGLSTEEALLDAIQDEEEEEISKKKRRVSKMAAPVIPRAGSNYAIVIDYSIIMF